MLSTQYIRTIRLVNFKKHLKARYDFGQKLNIITGPNGVGKTNLLDALYYACFSKSYFSGQDNLVFAFGTNAFSLDCEILQESDLHNIEIKNIKQEKKEVSVDGVLVEKQSAFAGRFPAVFVTPDDNQIVSGPAENRRKLIDSTLCQTDISYYNNLLKYNKLLSQRNALLKSYGETGRLDESLIDTYNDSLIPIGQAIHDDRVHFSRVYAELFATQYQYIFPGNESVSISYNSVLNNVNFQQLITKNRLIDLAAQRTTGGIHTDDWNFELNGFLLRKTGSQGQQKTFLLALKLAQYTYICRHRSLKPILFLDDIFDKFDRHRTAQLIKLVSGGEFGQVFITDTDKSRIEQILTENKISDFKSTELS